MWVCVFVENKTLSLLALAGQMFSLMGALGVALDRLVWIMWLSIYFFWYLTYLRTLGPLLLRLKAIYRRVWNSFSLFFFFFLNRLLIRTGSWFWTQVAPPAFLWPGSWWIGQLLLASCPSNPQPKTDYHQHFSTLGTKLVVTSDFTDLRPIYMPSQFDRRITGLMAWCFGWLRPRIL